MTALHTWSPSCSLERRSRIARPFVGATLADTLAAILQTDPPPIEASDRALPPSVDRIVRRCLEKEPAQRFQSARDVGFALEALGETSLTMSGGPTEARAEWRRRLAAGLGVAALVALGALGAALARRPAMAPPTAVRFQVALPEGVIPLRTPTNSSMALSPDGKQLAFVAIARGQPTLWLRSLGSLESKALGGTEGAISPFWSPDGRAVAFFSGGKLKKVATEGGPVETLCDAEFGNAGTWSPEGTVLFTEWGGREGLYRVSSRGGAAAAVELRTDSGPDVGIAWPAFLEDGRRFVYLSGVFGAASRGSRRIALASLGSPRVQHLGAADSLPIPLHGRRILYVREGTVVVQELDADRAKLLGDPRAVVDLVWFLRSTGSAELAASANGQALAFRAPPAAARLTWLDRAGRVVGTVGAPGALDGPRLSPDGTRVALEFADLQTGGRDIWVDDLARGVRSRVTFDPLDAVAPVWSPDGERLLYASASQVDGPLQMRVRRSDGSGTDVDVVRTVGAQLPQDWSSDGRVILFGDRVVVVRSAARRPARALWLVPPDGSRPPEPLEPSPVSRAEGRFSPDGRYVAFVSEEAGRPEVIVAPLGGAGRRQQVSTEGGFAPRWRRDGRELFYFSPAGKMMSVSLEKGPDGGAAPPVPLFALPGHPSNFGSGPMTAGLRYDVDARRDRFLIALAQEGAPPISVAVGWDAR